MCQSSLEFKKMHLNASSSLGKNVSLSLENTSDLISLLSSSSVDAGVCWFVVLLERA